MSGTPIRVTSPQGAVALTPQQHAMLESCNNEQLYTAYQLFRHSSGKQATNAVTCFWIIAPSMMFFAIVVFSVPEMGGAGWGWVLIMAVPIVLLFGVMYRSRSKENAAGAVLARRMLVARGVTS